jgi:hypothetical protein
MGQRKVEGDMKKLFIKDLEKRKSSSQLFASVERNSVIPESGGGGFRTPAEVVKYAPPAPAPLEPISVKYAPPEVVKYAPPTPDLPGPISMKYAPQPPDVVKYAPPTPDVPISVKYAPPEVVKYAPPTPLVPISVKYAPPDVAKYAPPKPDRRVTSMGIGEEGHAHKPWWKPFHYRKHQDPVIGPITNRIGEGGISPKREPKDWMTTNALGEEGTSPKPGGDVSSPYKPQNPIIGPITNRIGEQGNIAK